MEARVLIADDHSIVRMGLAAILKKFHVNQVDEVGNCSDLLAQLKKENSYSHLILDIIMPDGNSLEIIEQLNILYPDLSILIHSMQPLEVYGKIIKKYKIHSYLYKGVSENEINYHLEKFVNSEPITIQKIVDDEDNPFAKLAVRELEVLHYLLNGFRTKEISTALNLKMNTISTIKRIIYRKLRISTSLELFKLAQENHLV